MNRPQTQPAKLGPLLAVLGLLVAMWFGLSPKASAVCLPQDHSDLFAANSSPGGHQETDALPPKNRIWENFGNSNEITLADELNSLQLRWESDFGELELASGVLSYADGNPISLSDPFGLCADRNACTGGTGRGGGSVPFPDLSPITNSILGVTRSIGDQNPWIGEAISAVSYNLPLEALGPNPGMFFEGLVVKGAQAANGGLEGASFAQKTFSQTFSSGGKFAGQTIDDVAGALGSGAMKAGDVPIEYIVRDGNTLMLNTRSAQALQQAGIPRAQWNSVNMTGNAAAEARLTGQLQGNGLGSGGFAKPTLSGR